MKWSKKGMKLKKQVMEKYFKNKETTNVCKLKTEFKTET